MNAALAPAAPSDLSISAKDMTASNLSPEAVHRSALVIDTHADTPQRLLDDHYDLAQPLGGGNFNIETARAGSLVAEFFSIWVEPALHQGKYTHRTLELIDAVKRQVALHPDALALATSPDDIERVHHDRRLAILLGIEGGHSIENSLGLLRQYYALGVRYMTLTWNNSNGWADSSGDVDDPAVPHTGDGLSAFGVEVIQEMNRLGMMVDISHVSQKTLLRTLAVSRAPVLASHSSARALCDVPRNLTDDELRAVANSGRPGSNGGVVQVNFYSGFLSPEYRTALETLRPKLDREIAACRDRAKAEGRVLHGGELEAIRKAAADQLPRPPLSMLVDHIDRIARVAGIDHVGLGSDFDGVAGQLPEGMNSPADLPKITAALMERGYSPGDCHKILGKNLMRLFREVQAAAERA